MPRKRTLITNEFTQEQNTKQLVNENIKELGVSQVPEETTSNIHCLTIVGQIEGHLILPPQNKTTKYEHIIPQLVAVEQSSQIEGLLIILNTVGGDVEAGLAIAEIIDGLSKPTVSIVLGGGHSIGVPIAVAADYSFYYTYCNYDHSSYTVDGDWLSVFPQTYEYLDKMQDRVVQFVEKHSKISQKDFRELMFRTGDLARDIGTVLVGKDAVNIGLIDELGSLSQAVNKLKELIKLKKTGGRPLQ